jgi:hypothetical protein
MRQEQRQEQERDQATNCSLEDARGGEAGSTSRIGFGGGARSHELELGGCVSYKVGGRGEGRRGGGGGVEANPQNLGLGEPRGGADPDP